MSKNHESVLWIVKAISWSTSKEENFIFRTRDAAHQFFYLRSKNPAKLWTGPRRAVWGPDNIKAVK